MTFTEKYDISPFDWNNFLAQPVYYLSQLNKARELAGDWVTYACGNQCSIIPRFGDGEPRDGELRTLGLNFYDAIKVMLYYRDDYEAQDRARNKAIEILAKIERRSTSLIAAERYRHP